MSGGDGLEAGCDRPGDRPGDVLGDRSLVASRRDAVRAELEIAGDTEDRLAADRVGEVTRRPDRGGRLDSENDIVGRAHDALVRPAGDAERGPELLRSDRVARADSDVEALIAQSRGQTAAEGAR